MFIVIYHILVIQLKKTLKTPVKILKKMRRIEMNKCVLCGEDLPFNIRQITFATEDKGIESACMNHEFSKELKEYIKRNGGVVPILEALKKNSQ